MFELVLLASMAVSHPAIVVTEIPVTRAVVIQSRRIRAYPNAIRLPAYQKPVYRVYRGQVIQVQRPLGPITSFIENVKTKIGFRLLYGF